MNTESIKHIRDQFPVFKLHESQGLRRLGYLDTAASSQKPKRVIDRISQYLSSEHANIHRGAYKLSSEATRLYDEARGKISQFLGAASEDEIVFTRGTTESVNLVAYSLEHWFQPGDAVLVSLLEHHSNIVPWQLLAQRRGIQVAFSDIHDDASFNIDDFVKKARTLKPKLIAITYLSNAFGTPVPIETVAEVAREIGAKLLVDGAQAAPHKIVRLKESGIDFFACSGHKLYGPTGIGCLYVREENYNIMAPFQGGGDMIATVSVEGSTWAESPRKFEAGTPAIAEAIGFGETIDFLNDIGMKFVEDHEAKLFPILFERISSEKGVKVYGPAASGKLQSSILSFTVEGVHPHDIATFADSFGVQIRAGHHCAMPAMKRLKLHGTARASLGIYSEEEDFDGLIEAIRAARAKLTTKS